jgi:predicted TIM-barrel fold metal-dependent hydrolase
MIWDLHGHIATIPGRTPDERMARFIELANRMGIERLCIYMGEHWSHDPSPEDMRQQNDDVLQALSHWHHRAFGFVYLNPKHVEASLAEIDRCIRNGPMVGVKLWTAHRCSEKELDPIVEAAGKLKAVIFQHTWLKTTGNEPGESSPADLVALAQRHPGVSFICGHTGGDWERGIRTIRPAKNISTDLAGFDPTAGVTEMAVRELGAERILYGSDAGGRSFASQLAKVYGANISEHDKKLILGPNLKRLLTPILKEKGISV